MKDLKRITIKIAGLQAFDLDIAPDRQDAMERVERNVNKLWAKWCREFPDKDPQDILAMVTFQYARFYYNLLDITQQNEKAILDFERQLDEILLDVE